MIAVGLMSGTSGDGVDAAVIELDVPATEVRLLASTSAQYPKNVRDAVLALGEGGMAAAADIARLHALLGDFYADATLKVMKELRARPDVVAMHGQTVSHLPDDLAAGGQGAPLVPFADHVLFARLAPVAVLNIGGIANLTIIPTKDAHDVIAFDTGPGNMVIDGVAAAIGATHDVDGAGARRGTVDQQTLAEFLAHPYFAKRAPKSTGREQFGQTFAQRLLEMVTRRSGGSHDDALATATALTARTIADGLSRESRTAPSRLLLAGGGARNPALAAAIAAAVAPVPVETTDGHGVPASLREAIAFAILGAYRLRGLPNTLPSATGASRAVSGGALHIP
jgi:anhydro-N-acetylmuramic acid kinase